MADGSLELPVQCGSDNNVGHAGFGRAHYSIIPQAVRRQSTDRRSGLGTEMLAWAGVTAGRGTLNTAL